MNDRSRPQRDRPGTGRFEPLASPGSDVPLYHPDESKPPLPVTPAERAADVRADIEEIVARCQQIVDRGEAEFFDEDDARNRLAAKALLIDLATACEQLDEFKSGNPELWRAIKRTRDKMAHHYRGTSFVRVWETISIHVPMINKQLQQAPRDA